MSDLAKNQNNEKKKSASADTPPAKVTRIRRYPFLSGFHFGNLVFILLFLYLCITLFLYLSRKHVVSYEVIQGALSGNYRFSALALKDEEVVRASESGGISYYAREGAKANAGMLICSVGPYQNAQSTSAAALTEADYENARDTMMSFTLNFDPDAFLSVYDFKSDVESFLLQSGIDESAGTYVSGSYSAKESGFILYSVDGDESLTEEDLKPDLFNASEYKRDNLRLDTQVNAGDPIYTLVRDNPWYLYFPLDAQESTELSGRETIRFRFLRDSSSFSAPFEIISIDGTSYGKITLNNSLVRYVPDRFLDIELIMNRASGLKIPTSAIADKVFYQIPQEYAIVNSDTDSEITLLKQTFAADGSEKTEYISAVVYGKSDGYYLVDPTLFETGNYVLMTDTNRKYLIDDSRKETIRGVYNVNKGYAVFREITVVDENEEFCIVAPNNVYGLAPHDRIVLDASTVKEGEIVT